jgi:sterol desaturase/sphingolipid hydroxylase (fatty acid hydroxylase superfamily)
MYITFTVCQIALDFLFYGAHRALHSKALYAAVHKQHHAFVGTRSFAAEHAHPVEDILANYIPFSAGLLLCGAHFHLAFVWFFCRLTEVYESHSGWA